MLSPWIVLTASVTCFCPNSTDGAESRRHRCTDLLHSVLLCSRVLNGNYSIPPGVRPDIRLVFADNPIDTDPVWVLLLYFRVGFLSNTGLLIHAGTSASDIIPLKQNVRTKSPKTIPVT